jgi:hypothetical protein
MKKSIAVLVLILATLTNADNNVNLIKNGGFEQKGFSLPWSGYQFSIPGMKYSVSRSLVKPHSGKYCLQITNEKWSQGGIVYTQAFKPGDYCIKFWAKTDAGRIHKIQAWLGSEHTDWIDVVDKWQLVRKNVTLKKPAARLVIRTRAGYGAYYIDDVSVEPAHIKSSPKIKRVPAYTKASIRQKTLIFSPMNVVELGDSAKWLSANGIDGVFLYKIMEDSKCDIWATDGNPKTRGKDDKLFQEVLKCNQKCAEYGITSNFVKIAFSRPYPDFFDTKAVGDEVERFAQAAKFARFSKCRGIALDFEYVGSQYPLNLRKDINQKDRSPKAYMQKAYEYGNLLAKKMYRMYPDMDLCLIWENVLFAGAIGSEIVRGIVNGAAQCRAIGKIYIMSESTYSVTDYQEILKKWKCINLWVSNTFEKSATRKYSQKHVQVSLGMWPIGKSYSDNKSRYSSEKFKEQVATVRKCGGDYNWIYTLANAFSPQTDASAKKYRNKTVHYYWPKSGKVVPANSNLKEYCDIIKSDVFLK